MPPDMAPAPEEKDIARLEMLSDGVFAIAITLLGLELKVPDLSQRPGASLVYALGQQWHLYLAVVTSFFTILVVWMNHHGCVQSMKRINIRFFIANGFLLFSVICFPFVTGLLGEYFTTEHAAAASSIYAGVCLLTNVGFNLLWGLAAAHGRALIRDDIPPEVVRAIRRNCAGGFFAYLVAMASAIISAYLCIAICTFLWIFWAVTLKSFKEQTRGRSAAR
ncbi:MAG TPA: TMEM175 family protein [Vicinamibacterales bacterium]|nr:TMEM175 family protein [Vicinamibacterales bacterium]